MRPASTPRLIAIDLPGGPDFVVELRRIWHAGHAALPLDQRLPRATRDALASQLRVGDPVEPGDALVMATSGSTGTPKGVVLTHDALAAHAAAVHAHLGVDPAHDHWWATLPLAHIGGLGVVVRALLTDTSLTVAPRFDPDQRTGNLVSLVPTALDRLSPAQSASFKWIVLGGSGDTTTRPSNVVHTYGMTESGGGVVYEGAVLPGIEVRAVDGELWLRGPTMLRTYRDGTVPFDTDGWYRTGDLGSVNAQGTVAVEGRRDHLIISGGENVWPEAVEEVLRNVHGVEDVAVAGRSDPEWGARIVAYVVANGDVSLAALRDAARDRLASYALPRELVLTDHIPRTALGKIQRGALQ